MNDRLKKLVVVGVVVLIVAGIVIIGRSAFQGGGLDPDDPVMTKRRDPPAETRRPPGPSPDMTPADE